MTIYAKWVAADARFAFSNEDNGGVAITLARHSELLSAMTQGKRLIPGAGGSPAISDPEPYVPTETELCRSVDQAADAARRAVAGDPLRAVEYERAASEAQAFSVAGYQGEVPPMVAAWAINGRTAQQAADDILGEAAQYNGALVQLRAVRLQAKEQIRTLMAASQVGQAQQVAEQTIAAIEAAVSGIGNAGA